MSDFALLAALTTAYTPSWPCAGQLVPRAAPLARQSSRFAVMASRELGESVALELDLGPDGEPAGKVELKFAPILQDSEFIQLDLGLPLGMVIEVQDDGGGSIAGRWYQKTRVVITDALPGYSSYRNVQAGDVLRAITAYRTVLVNEGGYSAWKQLTSYTPVGEPMLKRLVFKCEGATYDDIREAIQSHREGNSIATLIIERARAAATPEGAEEDADAPRTDPA